jgi:hypothetical protein
LLDTGCPVTLLCKDFYDCQLGPAGASIDYFPDGPRAIFNAINGKPVEEEGEHRNEVKAIGVLRVPPRLSPYLPADTRPRFRIHGDSSLDWWDLIYVSEHPIGGAQILMGQDYIKKRYALIRCVGAAGFQSGTSSSQGHRLPTPVLASSRCEVIL